MTALANGNMLPRNPLQTVVFLDDARCHACYNDNAPADCLAEWLLFNARSMVRAEAAGDANYVLELGRQRQNKLRRSA